MKLSHTSHQTYKECSYKWKLHYQDKLRSTQVGSALHFGKSLDDALNRILLEKKCNLTDGEKLLLNTDEFTAFNSSFDHMFTSDNQVIEVNKSTVIEYFKSDFDYDLLNDSDIDLILAYAKELNIDLDALSIPDLIECMGELKKEKKTIDKDLLSLHNYACFLSLRRKAHILIQAYRDQILPKIQEVYSIQEPVSLPDDEHELIGYIDFIASFVDRPGVMVICDNKTSSRSYTEEAANQSEQLAIYSEYKNIKDVAFVVLEKKLRKKEPRVRTRIVFGVSQDSLKDKVFEDITTTLEGIVQKDFTKNWEACYSYGRPCQYFNYCRTRDLTNLEYPKEKK